MAPHLSSLQRSQVLALRASNLPLSQIAHQLRISLAQVRYTVRQNSANVARRSGRPRLLSPEQVDRVVAFVSRSSTNQAIPWAGIAPALGIDCSVWAIRRALRLRGFSRGHALGRTALALRDGGEVQMLTDGQTLGLGQNVQPTEHQMLSGVAEGGSLEHRVQAATAVAAAEAVAVATAAATGGTGPSYSDHMKT